MIRCLLTGSLYGNPQARTSQAGKPFTTAKVRADGKDGASVWCSLIAFGDLADRLAALVANQAVAVSGKAELSVWTGKDGNPAAGLSLVVDELATLKGKLRPPQGQRDAHQARQGVDATQHPQRAQQAPGGIPFDDELPDFM